MINTKDSDNMKLFVRDIVAIFILALIVIKIMTECLLRRRRSRNDVPKDRLSVIGSTCFMEKQIVSTILQSRHAIKTREDYLTSNKVQTEHNGLSSGRFYDVINCQPLVANLSCTKQRRCQSEDRPIKIIDERDIVEKIIDCPESKMEASKTVSHPMDEFTQTREIPSNKYSITAVEENHVTFTDNVEKKTSYSSCSHNFRTETQATQTFQFKSRFTQTAPLEIQDIQAIQEETQPEKKHAPTITTINTQTPYSVPYRCDSRNYKQEREYEHRMNYRSQFSQEDPCMARYPVDIKPYIFPTGEEHAYYCDPNLYAIYSSISENPVMKQNQKVEKTKKAETNDKNEEKRVTESIRKYFTIQQSPPVHTSVPEEQKKAETNDKNEEIRVTETKEKYIVQQPPSVNTSMLEEQTQTVEANATSTPSDDVHKSNKYRDYSNNQISRYPMNKQSQLTAISGPRSSLKLGQNGSISSGQNQETTLISETDLNKIWKKIHQSRQYVSKKSVNLDVSFEFLKQDQYNSQCQEKNIHLADYDTNYSKLSSTDNESGVLQRYFEDVSNNAEQTKVQNDSLLNQTSLNQIPSRSTHVSGFICDMDSTMPNAATIRQRNKRLHPKL